VSLAFFNIKKLSLVIEFVYGNLRFCVRGISNGNSEVGKNATNFDKALN
jgi:hypothetical protein